MKRKDVIETLVAILKEIQSEVGDEADEIGVSTCPFGSMGGFDSLMGVVVTVRCFDKFDIEDDNKTVSFFEPNKSGEPVSVGDVADKIVILQGKELGK
jgi:hypothetical protein